MTQLIPASTRDTILKNANTLFQNGYRIELIAGDGLFRIFNLNKPSSYTVETRGEKTCECVCFQRYGFCKHCEGVVLLIQSQICSYYLRAELLRAKFKAFRGSWQEKQYRQAFLDKIESVTWELECAMNDLTGSGEFYMPRRLTGYVEEMAVRGEDRRKVAQ